MSEIQASSSLAQVVSQIKGGTADMLNRAARMTVDVSKSLAPVLTGELRDSIEQTEAATAAHLEARVEVKAEHGLPVEFGHSTRGGGYVPARPFFLPAVEQAKREMEHLK